jgi:hypothetical protein
MKKLYFNIRIILASLYGFQNKLYIFLSNICIYLYILIYNKNKIVNNSNN